ncbi:GMC oxidoreductase [Streptomyces acidiscabies]|uniref:GMC oxidoreductase n=1 Tax=Streptomyces acidiscabies TaxID=42234 RepID=A0AAP6BIC4_9ACTN|nr:GMC oxidoreductase [Streptomyces acidiscabies]MBP5942285.1 choline dehydrogenase [Streptomyces sp. LBUM 1476]MBZ3913818.1 GMC family oxidoreductase N-terminal domain-containing protein [Streptomyces acidiscabies]MDX2965293.1 GMC oxidoreductase [Streptomyces acidiscabies]MDX3022091.1 GMC oxidoreductase [Streptomyces acidiscabies]MDX3793655.1 GMC oxidoreductase [Streptomyces acidiscabies]
MTGTSRTGVLIVGSGIMGSLVARLLRDTDPALDITMVDGGRPIGSAPGLHLHDLDDPALWARYNEQVATGVQGLYTGADVVRDVADSVTGLAPGMFHALAFGQDAEAMPAAALAWNAGGMGVHWTAATPWPAGDEVFDFGDPDRWTTDLDTARRLLAVTPAAIGPTPVGRVVLDVLGRRFDGVGPYDRQPQPMPMAVTPTPTGPMPRTAPGTIFPPIAVGGDPAFTLLTGTLATALVTEDGRALGARLRRVADGAESELRADTVVVCADALRTPQLLFASGIRPQALGRHLNEHAFISARVLLDLDRFGIALDSLPLPRPGEFATDSLWLPHNGAAQPFHGQVMNRTYVDDTGRPLAHSVGLSLYVPVESRPENRLVFSETRTDLAGMPRITVEFGYSDADRALIDRALGEVRSLAEEFGTFDPATERALLPPGSSLHQTGTVRAGLADDGASVCDPDGRVWGFDNLYLAGNGVIPTAMAANVTLAGAVTAVRAARAVAARPLKGTRNHDRRPEGISRRPARVDR